MFLERRFACWTGLGAESRGEAMEEFQSRQLRALVRHAYDRVPYYRLLFDRAQLKPEHVRGIQDLPRIPLTSRTDLQRCDPAETVARGVDPQRLVVHRTSGSSGQPLSIRRTAFEDRMLQAYRLKVLFRLGLRLSDRRAAVVTQRLAQPPLYTRLGILRYEEVHCLLPADRILARLREIRPDVLRVAEVVQDGRSVAAGEQGEFVGTALHSWAMPFIRFRLGDMVTRGEEPSTLKEIQGRLIDRFMLPDGSTIHPFTLVNPLLHNAPWLLQYQLVQERPNRIRVKLVPMPGAHPTPHAFEAVRKALIGRLGSAVRVEVELTEYIPADANGKFRPYYRV